MKFSIISPSYNQGRFLPACLQSVQDQASPSVHVEHIVLDNCSTDQTAQILEGWSETASTETMIRKLIVEPDRGQSHAINKGFDAATGDVVAWLNTDEFYLPNALELVMNYFREHPEVDVVFGDCNFIDIEGRVVKQKREFLASNAMLLEYGCYIPSCATFIRRKILDAGHRVDETYRVAMDFELYARLMSREFRFAHMRSTLAAFTWHDRSISATEGARRISERRRIQDQYIPSGRFRLLRKPLLATALIKWRLVRGSMRVLHRMGRATSSST